MLISVSKNSLDMVLGLMGKGLLSHPSGEFGNKVTIFGADKSSSVHLGIKKEDILNLVQGPTQGLDSTTPAVENMYSIYFTG